MKNFLEIINKGIEERFGFRFDNLWKNFKNFLKKPVSYNISIFNSFGVIIILLFLILLITGVLLSFYYKPTPEDASSSIKYIMNQLPYGWLIRSIHYWSSNLLVLSLFAHFWRVYFTSAYRNPRELLYLSGLFNMFVIFLFTFTGGLLPWDNASYWATAVMTSELKDFPIIGEYLSLFIRGGFDVSSGTLTRFFVAHILILPSVFILLLFLHLLMIHTQGLSNWLKKPQNEKYTNLILIIDTGIIIFGIFATLVILSVFFPSPLGQVADMLRQPEELKPSWFMLPLFKIYKIIPFRILFFPRIWIFSFIAAIIIIFFVLLPFVDRGKEINPLKKPFYSIAGVVLLIGAIILIITEL